MENVVTSIVLNDFAFVRYDTLSSLNFSKFLDPSFRIIDNFFVSTAEFCVFTHLKI